MNFIKVRKKPVEVEAFQLSKELWDKQALLEDYIEIGDFIIKAVATNNHPYFLVSTLEDVSVEDLHRAEINDWIIKHKSGGFSFCKDFIFEEYYDLI